MLNENETEDTVEIEVVTPSVEDLLQAINSEKALDASKIFSDLMSSRVDGALEQEKIRIANQLYNGVEEEDIELEEPSEEEIEAAFQDEEPVAEVDSEDTPEDTPEDDSGLYSEMEKELEDILSDEELPEE
jgi:hypothetical protein